MTTQRAAGSQFKKGKKGGPGRPKGLQNKVTRDVKEMTLQALSMAGGVEYLARQAESNPTAFLSLVGKVLPLTVQGTGEGGAFRIEAPWLSPSIVARNSA